MSMKATMANIEFQQRVEKYNKQLDNIDHKIDNLNEQLGSIIKAMQKIQTVKGLEPIYDEPVEQKDKFKKIDLDNNSPMFIPDIDTSDLQMSASEEEKTIKELDLEFGLNALNDLEDE